MSGPEGLSADERVLAAVIAEARWPATGVPIHQGGDYERALVARAVLASDWYAALTAERDALREQVARVEALADEPWLITESVALIWREHSNCNWVVTKTEVGPEWSCGVIHQPTTRDRHVGTLVADHIARRLAAALHPTDGAA